MNPNTEPTSFPPPVPLPETPLEGKLDIRILFEALLRRPRDLVSRLAEPGHGATGKFLLLAVVAVLLFGLVLGCFAKHEQLWAAPLKIVCGLLFSGLICFPSLYIFSTLAGARVSVSQLAACLAGAMALAGLLLLGFAPAVWIFAESTDSLGFMGALALIAWLVAAIFALGFLGSAVVVAGGRKQGPMVIWSLIFLLVTLQMTTSLRPILGRTPDLLTQEKKFFIQHWLETSGSSLKSGEWENAGTPVEAKADASPSDGVKNPHFETR